MQPDVRTDQMRGDEPERPQPASTSYTVDDAAESMTGSVVSGAVWSAVGRLGSQIVQFASGLALARLLVPGDFGLAATVYVVTGFATVFFDMGLSAALVHQREPDEESMATAFWINLLGGGVFVGLLWLIAPLVADFYDKDQLRTLVPLAGLSFALYFGVTHSALLQRKMRFRAIAIVEVSTAVVSNGVTLAAAAAGAGAKALVIGPALQSLLLSVSYATIERWRPRHFIVRSAWRRLWSFSGGMLGFTVVNFVIRNFDTVAIGRVRGVSELGLYNRGYNLMLLPVQQVSQVVGRVMFPALTSMGDDRERLQRAYRRVIVVITALLCPVLVGMAAVAEGLVPLLWGEGWDGTIPILQVLCLAGLPQTLSSSEGWLYQSQGKTNLMFKMGSLSTAIGVVGVLVGLHWGALGVAWGLFVTAWVYQPWALSAACGTIGLKARLVVLDVLPTVVISLAMGALVWALPPVLGLSRLSAGTLLAQVVLGAVSYSAAMLLLRRSVIDELKSLRPGR